MELEETSNYQRWLSCQNYMKEKGFDVSIPENVDFFEGRQWARVTEKTKHIPRPVVNICSKIVSNKLSNILGSPVKLNFRSDNEDESTEKFTKFASYQMKEMNQEYYDYLACLDGLVKNTYTYYYYWDENAIGRQGVAKGGLRCEIIDPLNIGFANPRQSDCQKQEWIIIRDRQSVASVKKMCSSKKVAESIVSDDFDTDYSEDIEQRDSKMVTVYTRFFRKDGEVYFEKSTRYADIHKPIPMNPLLVRKLREEKEQKRLLKNKDKSTNSGEDTEVVTSQDSNLENETISENKEELYKFYFYPVEVGCLTPRDHCIYGISEVEGIKDNQRAVNFQLSMILLNAQSMGMGKILLKAGALKNQVVNNSPAQVLIDHTPIGSWGIKMLEGQQFSNGAFDVANIIIEMTRSATNSTDVITGDMISKDLSGTAIAQIQAQGQKPIEQMQKRFWRSKERIGKILEQFYKLFYEDAEYSYEISEETAQLRQKAMEEFSRDNNYNGVIPPVMKTTIGTFNGADFQKTPFNIVVEAGKGTQYSEIMAMDFVNNLIMNGNINNINPDDLELLIDMYPTSAIPDKSKLKTAIKNKKMSMITQLQGQVQQLTQLLQEAKNELDSREGKINALSQYTKQLNSEYGKVIANQNKKISDMTKALQSTDASKSDEKNVNKA